MLIAVRSSTLLLPLAAVSESRIAGRCLQCRTVVSMSLASTARHQPAAVVGQVASRLRCVQCGSRPSALVLIEGTDSSDSHHGRMEVWDSNTGPARNVPPSLQARASPTTMAVGASTLATP